MLEEEVGCRQGQSLEHRERVAFGEGVGTSGCGLFRHTGSTGLLPVLSLSDDPGSAPDPQTSGKQEQPFAPHLPVTGSLPHASV